MLGAPGHRHVCVCLSACMCLCVSVRVWRGSVVGRGDAVRRTEVGRGEPGALVGWRMGL